MDAETAHAFQLFPEMSLLQGRLLAALACIPPIVADRPLRGQAETKQSHIGVVLTDELVSERSMSQEEGENSGEP